MPSNDEKRERRSRAGLRPTLRQLTIVVLWSAIISAGARALLNWRIIGVQIEFDCILIPLLASSFPLPILAILIRLLDLKGPVREWYRACCMAAASAFSGILYLTQDAICFALTGRNTLMFPISPLLGAFFIVVAVFQIKALWPSRCVVCHCQAVIAVARRHRRGSKPKNDHLNAGSCARCGAEYQRKGTAAWRLTSPAVT
jgi:hypothetical protein